MNVSNSSIDKSEWTPTACLLPSSEMVRPFQAPTTIRAEIEHLEDMRTILNTAINSLSGASNNVKQYTGSVDWAQITSLTGANPSSTLTSEKQISRLEVALWQTQNKIENMSGYLTVASTRINGAIKARKAALVELATAQGEVDLAQSIQTIRMSKSAPALLRSIGILKRKRSHQLKQRACKSVTFPWDTKSISDEDKGRVVKRQKMQGSFNGYSTEKMLADEDILFPTGFKPKQQLETIHECAEEYGELADQLDQSACESIDNTSQLFKLYDLLEQGRYMGASTESIDNTSQLLELFELPGDDVVESMNAGSVDYTSQLLNLYDLVDGDLSDSIRSIDNTSQLLKLFELPEKDLADSVESIDYASQLLKLFELPENDLGDSVESVDYASQLLKLFKLPEEDDLEESVGAESVDYTSQLFKLYELLKDDLRESMSAESVDNTSQILRLFELPEEEGLDGSIDITSQLLKLFELPEESLPLVDVPLNDDAEAEAEAEWVCVETDN